MRIQFKTEGGIAYLPGLSAPVTIDTAELPEPEAGELMRLVEEARFFDQPPTAAAPTRGAADYRTYTVTVEDGRRRHTVRFTDPVGDTGSQRLLDYLKAKTRAMRDAARGGPSGQPPG